MSLVKNYQFISFLKKQQKRPGWSGTAVLNADHTGAGTHAGTARSDSIMLLLSALLRLLPALLPLLRPRALLFLLL